MNIQKTALWTIAALLVCSAAFGARVHMKSGKVIEGEIVEDTPAHVKVMREGHALTYFKMDIDRIDQDKPAAKVKPDEKKPEGIVIPQQPDALVSEIAPVAPVQELLLQTQDHQDQARGFSCKYPADWRAKDDATGQVLGAFATELWCVFSSGTALKPVPAVVAGTRERPAQCKAYEDYMQWIKEKSVGTGELFSDPALIFVNGERGMRWAQKSTVVDVAVIAESLMLFGGKDLFIVTVYVPSGEYPAYRGVIKTIFESIRLPQ
jgi:hypothetical protein